MENASYIGLSLQVALRRQMDVVANNIANMSTTGFKNEKVLFVEHMVGPKGGQKTDMPGKMSMVSDYASYRDLAAGPVTQTGAPLDIAIQGSGYLTVQTPQGPRYSRGGALSLNNEGTLVDRNGLPVLDDGGGQIQIPERTTKITIGTDGTVSVAVEGQSNAQNQLGKIGLVKFDRPQFMQAQPGGLFSMTEPALPDLDSRVQQGSLEQSNVNPVLEMSSMIEIQRSYQTVSKMLDNEHERERNAIAKLSRIA